MGYSKLRKPDTYCEKCGSWNNAGSVFCKNCGANLRSAKIHSGKRFSGSVSDSAVYQIAGAWRRWLARHFDIFFTCFTLSFIIGCLGCADFVFGYPGSNRGLFIVFVVYPIAHFILDGLIYSIFGKTPGKWLFGILILEKDGSRISPFRYFVRNGKVFLQGYGLGIPVLNLIAMAIQLAEFSKRRDLRERITTYDRRMDLLVIKEKQDSIRLVVKIFLFFSLVFSMYSLGSYLNGVSDSNFETATKMWDEAIEKGNEDVLENAVRLFHNIAEQGNVEAQNKLGEYYEYFKKDHVESVKWYSKAAEQGDATAQRILGACYYTGKGVERNEKSALKWWRKAADQGDAKAQCAIGLYFEIKEKNFYAAVKWYRKAAEQGEAKAQYLLANCYYIGGGVTQNLKEAVRLWQLSAAQGHVEAQCKLGICYMEGEGVLKDEGEGIRLIRKAACRDDALAQCVMGRCYLNGIGVDRDCHEAVTWFRKSALQGNAVAQGSLGACYVAGEGVRKDEEEGVRWIRKGAEQGEAKSQYALGSCYIYGLGVLENKALGIKWLRKSAEQGCAEAMELLRKLRVH